jgi:hypothetical protein
MHAILMHCNCNLNVCLFFRLVTIFSAVDVCANDKKHERWMSVSSLLHLNLHALCNYRNTLYIVIDHKINFPSFILAAFYFEWSSSEDQTSAWGVLTLCPVSYIFHYPLGNQVVLRLQSLLLCCCLPCVLLLLNIINCMTPIWN